jgi:hypothetical protein
MARESGMYGHVWRMLAYGGRREEGHETSGQSECPAVFGPLLHVTYLLFESLLPAKQRSSDSFDSLLSMNTVCLLHTHTFV